MELLNLSYHRRKTNGYRDIDPEAPASKAVFAENLEKLLGRLLAAICATVTFSEVVKRCRKYCAKNDHAFFSFKHHVFSVKTPCSREIQRNFVGVHFPLPSLFQNSSDMVRSRQV